MSRLTERMDRQFYPTFGRNWDDRLFRDRILRHLTPSSVVLDLGAGAGIIKYMDFRGQAERICGVDLDPRVVDNPFLDEGVVTDGASVPFSNATFDMVFSDNVLEHLADPVRVFSEVARVLKPGGLFLFKTPNRSHYVPFISRLTPHRFHAYVNRKRGRASEDTFPTYYRANSRADITRIAAASGLRVESIEFVEGRPEYLRMSAATYLVGLCYERIVNSLSVLDRFRVLLIGELSKPK
jgi:SAM-dependent methyltransferase